MNEIIRKLVTQKDLQDEEFKELLNGKYDAALFEQADKIRKKYYSNKVFIRGLVEISSICKNDCYYCGIRASNKNACRYRLTKEDIIKACIKGKNMGFSTFVLQGGEDLYFTDSILCDIIKSIKEISPDCAVTLSLGERSFESYQKLKIAGADRYLLRHEAASEELYKKLHPENMLLENRKKCLYDLKKLGYQVGAGFMVGAPYQTMEDIIEDIKFLTLFSPSMIGIGPFIPHKDTCFKDEKNGSVSLTLRLISILRICCPKALIPATTALGTLDQSAKIKALTLGANVIMPNLSFEMTKGGYDLYDNKTSTTAENIEQLRQLEENIKKIGYVLSMERGDSLLK